MNENLIRLEQYAREHNIPVLLDDTRDLLVATVRTLNPSRILEIGTAVGYSGTLMLTNSESKLVTIELNESNYNIATTTFATNGLSDRVTQILADARCAIEDLCNSNERFDFIFLDGPKGQYIKYLPYLVELLEVGGTIFADNVLYRGMVESTEFIPHKKRTIVVNLRKYINEVTNPDKFDTIIHRVGDGVAISKLLKK